MRVASFNVENLFERAKALNLQSWTAGKPILAAQAELNALLEEALTLTSLKSESWNCWRPSGFSAQMTVNSSACARSAVNCCAGRGPARWKSLPQGGPTGSAGSN